MSKEKEVIELEEVDKNPTEEDEKEEKKEEKKKPEKKEFILFRAAKAAGRAIKKTGAAINGFAHEHPWASIVITSGVTVAAVKGYEAITGTEVPIESPANLSLPEGNDEDPTVFPDLETDVSPVEISTDE